MYYNTTNETGDTLDNSRKKTSNQNVLVLNVFKIHEDDHLSPDEVTRYIAVNFNKQYPVTSIRRAITDLTTEGKLEKTDKKKMGNWGKQVHTWKLISK